MNTVLAIHGEKDFITQQELLKQLPISARTLTNWRKRRIIPCIKMPGSRRVLFHWKSVAEALMRQQTAVGDS